MRLILKMATILSVSFFLMPAVCSAQLTALMTGDRFAEIQETTGEVQTKLSAQDDWVFAQKGMRLKEDSEIKTGKDSYAVVLLDEKGATGKVTVKPGTWMRIAELHYSGIEQDKKTLLDLALGQVLVQAEKLKGESSFQVRTPTSTTSVRGTVFEVKVEEKDDQAEG